MSKEDIEPILPVEKRLVAMSLILALILLGIFLYIALVVIPPPKPPA